MGTGASGGNVQAIVANSNGNVVAAGTFTSMGGVANTNGLALWNGSAWSSIGTLAGGSSDGYALIYDRLGNLVLTGDFTSVGGVAAVNIAKRDTSGTWTAFGSGIGSSGLALAVSGNNTIYVAGSFLTANGGVTTVNSITYWNGTTWAAMGPAASPGLTGAANTAGWHLIFAPDGRLIVSGPFRTAGGVSCNHVAYWNGVSFIPFGSGVGYNGTAALADSTGIVDSFFLSNGTWFAGGQFGNPTSSFANPMAGGMVFPDSLALWTGSAWTYVDIDPPGNSKVSAVLQSSTETTYIGFDTSGTALAANFVSTYGGSLLSDTEVYPVFVITGPSSGTARIYQITDAQRIYNIYLNTTISAGEIITLDLRPGRKTAVSSVCGNIIDQVLPGSSFSTFRLNKSNAGFFFFASSSSVGGKILFQGRYWSVDGY
jgi:hypothetical protein